MYLLHEKLDDHCNWLNWLLLFFENLGMIGQSLVIDKFSLCDSLSAHQLYCSLYVLAVRAPVEGTKTQQVH